MAMIIEKAMTNNKMYIVQDPYIHFQNHLKLH